MPIPATLLEQWQSTPAQLAAQLAKFLALRRPLSDNDPKRLDLGMLKGTNGSAHAVLHVESSPNLHIAGHVLPVADVADWTDKGLTVERRALVHCVDSPVAAAGSMESAEQRKARLRQRRNELTTSGIHNFNQVLAQEENLSVSAIKQLLAEKKPPKNWQGLMPAAKGTVQKKPQSQR